MIHSAVLRLSLAYLAVLMVMSLSFSYLLYNVSTHELKRELRQPTAVELIQTDIFLDFSRFREVRLDEAKKNLLANLAVINLCVLAIGSLFSYGLARRHIQPIEDALEAQSRFAADASHELRTPLTAMQTEIEVSLRDKKLTLKEAKEQLSSNLEEVVKLRDLSDRLLRLARNDDEIELKRVNLKDVAKNATEQIETLAAAKKIRISNQATDVAVMANADHMEDTLVILLDNAIKYSEPKTTVTIKTRRQGHFGYITVSDQGQGIRKEDLPHIFDRFYRADHSRTATQTGGHGLGLSIAHKMVTIQAGTISAKSTVGKGSAFTIRLQLVKSK